MTAPESAVRAARMSDARRRGVAWICDHVADDGRPYGADERNAWWRVPWALLRAGETNTAAAVLAWAEGNALTDDGDLRPGPFGGEGPRSPVYELSAIAIAAWLLTKYDTAQVIMDQVARYQNVKSGGIFETRARGEADAEDLLLTGQAGYAALVTGRADIAKGVRKYLDGLWQQQPELPRRLYTRSIDGKPLLEFSKRHAFLSVVDFAAPRQAFYHPGMTAAFLAGYATQFGDQSALERGGQFLQLSVDGDRSVQFDDPESVQICKFGWGAAAMHLANPGGGYLGHVETMADWFVGRQRPDGAWAPSSFVTPDPTPTDLLWKSAEHLMDLAIIEAALAGSPATRPSHAA